MGIKKTKVSELPSATSLNGLSVLGVSADNKSVQVGMELLKGNAGADAFTMWQNQPGNAGKTFEDYMAAIKGDKGDDGNDGKSFKIIGLYPTLAELEAAIPDGTGIDGVYGVGTEAPYTYYAWVVVAGAGTWASQGQLQGSDGKSAYEIAVQNGFIGTEAEWLASLQGEDATITISPDAGNTLEQRENGLFVPAGSGGSGSGGGILVLPYVAPQRDADGNLTNSAAFVDAWGGILSAYLAAPDSHALYMDTQSGEVPMLRMPCNVMNIGGETDTVQWLISGFAVVNVPMSSSEPVPCKATVMAAVICNAAGEMQSLAAYAGEGIAAADGGPNLLGSDDAVIIDLGLDTGAVDEAKLKAAVQPVLAKLMTLTPPRVIVKCNAFYINGTFQSIDNQFVITAYGAHPYAVGDVNNTYIIRAGVIGTVANGTITTVQGGYVGQELTTTEAMNAALAQKAPLLPESLEEQLVPGEFWMSADGVKRQVYVKTVQGTTSAIGSYGASITRLLSGITSASIQHIDVSNTMGVNDTSHNIYLQIDLDHHLNLVTTSPEQAARPYILTFKYTKL